MTKIFIDGSAGTTGLRIHERLSERRDIELITLSDELRKDVNARRDALNNSDIAFLCLPDDAAKESASLIEPDNSHTAIIDTSTAHRVNDSWIYGLPELEGQRDKIANSKRVANPGCHATGFIVLAAPLVQKGIIKNTAKLSCFSLTSYSGGGKKMIAEYESPDRNKLLDAPRQYGISQSHKHLPEMQKLCGLVNAPIFCPIVCDYYAGMEVTITIYGDDINGNINDIKRVYADYYKSGLVYYSESDSFNEGAFISAGAFAGFDDLEIIVKGNDERILLISRFDNLGKGASGAAIQNMNILMNIDESTGLKLRR